MAILATGACPACAASDAVAPRHAHATHPFIAASLFTCGTRPARNPNMRRWLAGRGYHELAVQRGAVQLQLRRTDKGRRDGLGRGKERACAEAPAQREE